jgi:hypothetical protein
MTRVNEARLRFHAAFGLVFHPCSPTMVQKCWHALQEVPINQRVELVDMLVQAAHAKIRITSQ